jgi:magnesium-protoporphyrin IX monomethyl ester (oxidative) cyclase
MPLLAHAKIPPEVDSGSMAEKRDVKKVFLMFPPVRLYRETMKLVFSPLGISYVAALIRNDVDVEILDAAAEGFDREEILDESFIRFGLSLPKIRERIERFAPDIVGVTCLFSSVFPMVREICQEVKSSKSSAVSSKGNHSRTLTDWATKTGIVSW